MHQPYPPVRPWLFHMVALIGAIASMVCPVSPSLASDEIYVVNSYVHGPTLDWSTLVKLRGSDLAITDSLTLGSGAHSVALAPDGVRLWVTVPPEHRIEVVHRGSFEPIHGIVLEDEHQPRGIAFSPDGTRAYVGLSSSGQVGVFDAESYERLALIPVGGQPDVVAFTPAGDKAYVVKLQEPSGIAVINTSDFSVPSNIDIDGEFLQEAVVTPDGATLYVTNTMRHRIEVLRTDDDTLLDPIPTGTYPRALGISPDGRYLFVGYRAIGRVEMRRLPEGEVVAAYEDPEITDARRIVVRPDGSRFYMVDHGNDAAYAFDVVGEGFSRALFRDLNTIPGFQAAPLGLALLPGVPPSVTEPAPPSGPPVRRSLALIDCGPCPACFERFCDPRLNPELDLFLVWEREEEIARSFSRAKLGIKAEDGPLASAAVLPGRHGDDLYVAALPWASAGCRNCGSILFFNRKHEVVARIDGKLNGEVLGVDMDVWGSEVAAVSSRRLLRMERGKVSASRPLPKELRADKEVHVAFTADIDGDQRPEILLGAPFADAGQVEHAGRILVVGSRSNEVIDTLYGRSGGEGLGRSLQPLSAPPIK